MEHEINTLDAEQAGARFGLTGRTMLEKARRREIGHVRIGRRVRFTEQNLADFLAANAVGVGMVRSERSRAAARRRPA